MANKKDARNGYQGITELIKSISGQARILTIPRLFIDLLDGDIKAALFLSQAIYWGDRSTIQDGEFYKSYKDWENEIALSRFEITRIVKYLSELELIQVTNKRTKTIYPVLHYRVNMQLLTAKIMGLYNVDMQETNISDMQETNKSVPLDIYSNIHRLHSYINDDDDKSLNRLQVLTDMGVMGDKTIAEVMNYLKDWTDIQFTELMNRAKNADTRGKPGGLIVYWVRNKVKAPVIKANKWIHETDTQDPDEQTDTQDPDEQTDTQDPDEQTEAIRINIQKYLDLLWGNLSNQPNDNQILVGEITETEIEIKITARANQGFTKLSIDKQLENLLGLPGSRNYRVSVISDTGFTVHSSQKKIINLEDLING